MAFLAALMVLGLSTVLVMAIKDRSMSAVLKCYCMGFAGIILLVVLRIPFLDAMGAMIALAIVVLWFGDFA